MIRRLQRGLLAALFALALAGCAGPSAPAPTPAPAPATAPSAPPAPSPAPVSGAAPAPAPAPASQGGTGGAGARPAPTPAPAPAAPNPAPAPAPSPAAAAGGTAVGGGATGGTPAAPVPPTRTATQYPLTVRGADGVSVTIDRRPERIIAFGPSNTELLFGVGAGATVVGVDTYSDWPKPAIDQIARVGDLFDFSLEKLVDLKPDLIVSAPSKDVVPKMREVGLKVVVLDAADLQGIYDNLRLVGQITDHQDEAAQVIADMQARIAAIEKAVAGATTHPRVFYEVWDDPLMTAGPGSFIHDMIVRAGGVNIAEGAGQAWPTVSLEAMVKADPQIILTSDANWSQGLLSMKYPAWVSTTAAMTGRVYTLDPDILEHPSQRIVEGFEAVARLLHPELFKK